MLSKCNPLNKLHLSVQDKQPWHSWRNGVRKSNQKLLRKSMKISRFTSGRKRLVRSEGEKRSMKLSRRIARDCTRSMVKPFTQEGGRSVEKRYFRPWKSGKRPKSISKACQNSCKKTTNQSRKAPSLRSSNSQSRKSSSSFSKKRLSSWRYSAPFQQSERK